jgi:hypothetical protein
MVHHLMSPDKEQNTVIVINPAAILVFLFDGPSLPRRQISHPFTVSGGGHMKDMGYWQNRRQENYYSD